MNLRAAFCIGLAATALAGTALAEGYKPYRPYAVPPSYNPYTIDKNHPERPPKNPYDLPVQNDTGLTSMESAADRKVAREVEKYNKQYEPRTYQAPSRHTPSPAYKPPAYIAPDIYRPKGPKERCYFAPCP